MVFIETSLFTKVLPDYLSDEDYRGLQSYLLQKPDAGDIVKGTGESGKLGGHQKVEGKVAVFVPFTTGRSQSTKFGC